MAWHHALFELSLIMNIIVTVVYFSLLHDEVHAIFEGQPFVQVHMKIIHLAPLLTSFVNFYLTDIVFIRRHYKALVAFGTMYLTINFIGTKMIGKPLYSFLTWKDYTSILISAAILLLGVIFFNVLVQITQLIKQRTPYQAEKKGKIKSN
mmetsp:Transcript_844/g.885  ORF Transcript_844/g.885 Transcript_844/m.885 type:complete len:150 (-) Transcript_844:33-482(-)